MAVFKVERRKGEGRQEIKMNQKADMLTETKFEINYKVCLFSLSFLTDSVSSWQLLLVYRWLSS